MPAKGEEGDKREECSVSVRGRTAYRRGPTTITRRDFLRVSGVGLAGAALLGAAGCGGQEQSGAESTLTFTFNDPTDTLPGLIERFNQQNGSGIKAEYRKMPADTGQYFDQITTEFQAEASEIDVIAGDIIWPAQLASNGWIVDLSERFVESERQKFLPGPIEGNTYEGKIWGVPWFTDTGLLYYRRDLLEQAGFSEPPRTWDELKEQANRVVEGGDAKYGFVFQGAQYEGGVVNGMEYIRSSGGDVLEGSRVVIGSPDAVRGLAIEQSLVADGVVPKAVATYKEEESGAAFMQGDAVFLRNWPYVYDLLPDPEQSKITREQVGIAQIPVAEPGLENVNVGGGWNFFISAQSDKQDQAWEFIRFMSAPEQQKTWAIQGNFLPTLEALYEDEEVLEEMSIIALGREAIRNTTTPPVSPYYSDMSLEMADRFNASLKGEISPEQAAEELQAELERIVERGG
jgi:multiple sugar transport system substrate-binding protein